jgi:hypothetical protein
MTRALATGMVSVSRGRTTWPAAVIGCWAWMMPGGVTSDQARTTRNAPAAFRD